MAKANQRANSGKPQNRLEHKHKIPYRHRKKFCGNNMIKWVDKKKYEKYLYWRKKNYGR